MPVTGYTQVQYSGIWTMQQVDAAIAAGTWTGLPALYGWGQNAKGQLGIGNTTTYSSPKQVGSYSTSWSSISTSNANMSRFNSGGVKTDGTLWTWGDNTYGQLGLGNITNYSSPKQVGTGTNWSAVAMCDTVIALKTDGTLWSWGSGVSGANGLGNTTQYSSPKQVGALTTWLGISAGQYFMMAVRTNGTLWSWGSNSSGQLGIGVAGGQYSSPVQVGALTTWSKVSCGFYSGFAIKTNGTLWAWGKNSDGQLGFGNSTDYNSPKQVGALTDWLSVSCAYRQTIAVKTDGTLWAWGNNAYGQLGTGNRIYRSSPVQVGLLTTWSKAATGGNPGFSGAIRTDGTLWMWGYNGTGELGIGNRTNYSSPKQVGALTSWLNLSAGYHSTLATLSQNTN